MLTMDIECHNTAIEFSQRNTPYQDSKFGLLSVSVAQPTLDQSILSPIKDILLICDFTTFESKPIHRDQDSRSFNIDIEFIGENEFMRTLEQHQGTHFFNNFADLTEFLLEDNKWKRFSGIYLFNKLIPNLVDPANILADSVAGREDYVTVKSPEHLQDLIAIPAFLLKQLILRWDKSNFDRFEKAKRLIIKSCGTAIEEFKRSNGVMEQSKSSFFQAYVNILSDPKFRTRKFIPDIRLFLAYILIFAESGVVKLLNMKDTLKLFPLLIEEELRRNQPHFSQKKINKSFLKLFGLNSEKLEKYSSFILGKYNEEKNKIMSEESKITQNSFHHHALKWKMGFLRFLMEVKPEALDHSELRLLEMSECTKDVPLKVIKKEMGTEKQWNNLKNVPTSEKRKPKTIKVLPKTDTKVFRELLQRFSLELSMSGPSCSLVGSQTKKIMEEAEQKLNPIMKGLLKWFSAFFSIDSERAIPIELDIQALGITTTEQVITLCYQSLYHSRDIERSRYSKEFKNPFDKEEAAQYIRQKVNEIVLEKLISTKGKGLTKSKVLSLKNEDISLFCTTEDMDVAAGILLGAQKTFDLRSIEAYFLKEMRYCKKVAAKLLMLQNQIHRGVRISNKNYHIKDKSLLRTLKEMAHISL